MVYLDFQFQGDTLWAWLQKQEVESSHLDFKHKTESRAEETGDLESPSLPPVLLQHGELSVHVEVAQLMNY